MDPVRSRVRGIHRKQREKFLSLNDYEHHVALRRAKRKADLLCLVFIALAAWLAYCVI